jgi:hypothetical protein
MAFRRTPDQISNTYSAFSNTKLEGKSRVARLINPRHERFCQAIAGGMTASAAYVAAGYSSNRGNASRLNANESIRARTAELLDAAANKASKEQGHDLHSMVVRFLEIYEMALAQHKFTTALRCIVNIFKVLGYWNNPALVQWELNGIRIPQTKRAPEPRQRNDRLAKVIRKLREG